MDLTVEFVCAKLSPNIVMVVVVDVDNSTILIVNDAEVEELKNNGGAEI